MLRYYNPLCDRVVGRQAEIRQILATLAAQRNLILEGAPGTTKSTILRALTAVAGLPFFVVEGSVDLTPAKLVGHFNPARVMADDYKPEYFEPGPLTLAMRGGILYIEEFNRMPADTSNVLITAVEEGELNIPRYGRVEAQDGFRVVCAQNPYDDVGTVRISRAVYDRFCRVKLGYQSEREERQIVREKTGIQDRSLLYIAVRIARETRKHPEIKQGASVRGAIDMVSIAEQLRDLEGQSFREMLESAMLVAMSGKIWLQETTDRTPEEILREILQQVLRQEELADDSPAQTGDFDSPSPSDAEDQVDQDTADEWDNAPPVSKSPTGWEPLDPSMPDLGDELRRRARTYPDEVARFLDANRQVAENLLQSPDVLGLYSYIKDRVREDLRSLAERYASRLILKLASQISDVGVRSGLLREMPANLDDDEIELDATIERILDNRAAPLSENLRVLKRRPQREACVVILDHSRSMHGIKVAMAALSAATIALHFQQDSGVVAFNSQANILKTVGSSMPAQRVAEEILALDADGYTNIREALETAIAAIKGYGKKIGILLTDGDWNSGGSPLPTAALFDNLHVIGLDDRLAYEDLTSFDDYFHWYPSRFTGQRIRSIARSGNGRYVFVTDLDQIPSAITRCLSG